MEELALNYRGQLYKELNPLYPNLSYSSLDRGVKNITKEKYKYLLHLIYAHKNAELDSELFKLGVLN